MYCVFQEWMDKRFVEWQHHFSVLELEISGNEFEYSNDSSAAFICLLPPLLVFGYDDSKISMLFSFWRRLVGHGVIYILMSNEHHCTFFNIKFHLTLVGTIFQLVDFFVVFFKLHYVIWGVSWFVTEFCVIIEFGYFTDDVVIQVIDVYEK